MAFTALAQAPAANEDTYSDQFVYPYVSVVPIVYQTPKKILSQEQEAWIAYLEEIAPLEAPNLTAIAFCESGWRNIPNSLYDGEDGRFTAYGPFQILKSTAARYSTEDRRNSYANIRIAVALYRAEGDTPWLCHWK